MGRLSGSCRGRESWAVLASAWIAAVAGPKRKKPHGHYSVWLDPRLLVSQFRRCEDKWRGARRFRPAWEGFRRPLGANARFAGYPFAVGRLALISTFAIAV